MSRHLIAVSSRDLRPGDWILEQFGRVENRLVPFRDLNVSRPVDQGLMAPNGRSMLPLRLVRDFEASFPVPPTGFGFLATQRAGIRWRIYEVTSVPQFALEGLDADHWMHDRATLLVRRSGPVRVRARFAVFAPPGTDNNELTISAGGRLLQRCAAAREGLAECSFGVDTAAVGPDVGRPLDDWVALELRARHAFAPNQFGASRDTRALSFNFAESYGGGVWVWAGTGDQEPDPEASGVASVSAGR